MPLIQWIMQNLKVANVSGVVVSGSADVTKVVTDYPLGGVVVGGISFVSSFFEQGSFGGVVVGGSALDDVIIFAEGGGVVVGGSALESIVTIGQGGVIVSGEAFVTINHIYTEISGLGGVVVGGTASVYTDSVEICDKYLLPNHPKPSTADYSPQNIAPLIEFFTPIVAGVLGQSIDNCQVTFRYENNTPCKYDDDIFVQHPLCIGLNYTPELCPKVKSPELKKYEEYAKKSNRLRKYMLASPAKIEYFKDWHC